MLAKVPSGNHSTRLENRYCLELFFCFVYAALGDMDFFQKDLGLDSLDTVEVVMGLEEEFAVEIPDQEADKITTAEQAIKFIASHPQAK